MSRVTELRKSGQLEEAYRLAKRSLAERPNDIWAKRDFAWVAYDCMKRYLKEDSPFYRNMDAYVISLRQVRGLDLSGDESMFFENASLNVRAVVWDLANSGDTALPSLRKLLAEIVQWGPDTPLIVQGTIGGLLKGSKSDPPSVVKLMCWRGLDRFTDEDFERREVNGKKILSLAEAATNQYLKALSAKDQYGRLRYDEGFLSDVVDAVKSLIADPRCEDWQWPQKSLGELLMDMGRDGEATTFLASVVLAKPREAWAWHAFGKAHARSNRDAYVSCLYKGLSLSHDTKMDLSLHEESMQLFAGQGLGALAKAEAEQIDRCRRENGWPKSEAASRALLDFRDVEAATPKSLRSAYADGCRDAIRCLACHVPTTELYLEWVSTKNRKAGIVTLEERTSQSAWGRSTERVLVRSTVSLAGPLSDFDVAVGEVWNGILDNRRRTLLAVLPLPGGGAIRERVIRESIGALDLVTNEKTSKRTCFVRMPSGSARNDDLFVPPAVADSANDIAGRLVSVKERLVFRRGRAPKGERDAQAEGKWHWEVASLQPAGEERAAPIERDALTQFYVDRIIDEGLVRVATLSTQTGLGGSVRLARPFAQLDVSLLGCRYTETNPEVHHVYQGQIYGKTRRIVIGGLTEINSGILWQETVKPSVTGIYETSNGWGHIGCPEGASVPPRAAQSRSIEPGSKVTARLYRTFVKDGKRSIPAQSDGSKEGGRWEWHAEDVSAVAPPESRMVEGIVNITAGGYGFLETVDGYSCFIPSAIVGESQLENDDHIVAGIRKSWNRKKSEEGWTVSQVESTNRSIGSSGLDAGHEDEDECDSL